MTNNYILVDKTPVEEPDVITWAHWYETADCRVNETRIDDVRISTVFLGMNYEFSDGPPLLFETIIVGGEHDEYQVRHSTWEEAEAGHTEAVALVRQVKAKPRKETMYENFTDRARQVMQLANQQSQRFNHEYIGTEHILLGLIEMSDSTAVKIIGARDVDVRKIRLEVEKLVQSGTSMVTMGKLQLTTLARLVIKLAIGESEDMNHGYVGTEHLLLGLIPTFEGVASQVLTALGLTLEVVREAVIKEWIASPQKAPTGTTGTLILANVSPTKSIAEQYRDLTVEVEIGKKAAAKIEELRKVMA